MSTPERRARRPRPRAGLAVQLGQTLLVLGAAVLVVGLFLEGASGSVWVGGAMVLVGAVLFAVGLRNRRRDPQD